MRTGLDPGGSSVLSAGSNILGVLETVSPFYPRASAALQINPKPWEPRLQVKPPQPSINLLPKKNRAQDLLARPSMAKRLIPSLNRVLVEKLLQPKKSVGGILLPETTKQVTDT